MATRCVCPILANELRIIFQRILLYLLTFDFDLPFKKQTNNAEQFSCCFHFASLTLAFDWVCTFVPQITNTEENGQLDANEPFSTEEGKRIPKMA